MQDWHSESGRHTSAAGPDVRDEPTILIISDKDHGANIAERAASAIGARLVGKIAPDRAQDRLDQQVRLDAVMIECGDSDPEIILPLINRLSGISATRPVHTTLAPSIEHLNAYAHLLDRADVTLICDGDVTDRIVALQSAFARKSVTVHDSASDLEPLRLKRIADEVGRIAKALANLSEQDTVTSPDAFSDVLVGFRAAPAELFEPLSSDQPDASELRGLIRARRLRDQYFAADLFGDPVWDMLLDLWAARFERVQISVSSLCIASAVPPTTALRWIKRMTDDGLLERVADTEDGRRVFVRLSDAASVAMQSYWKAAHKASPVII